MARRTTSSIAALFLLACLMIPCVLSQSESPEPGNESPEPGSLPPAPPSSGCTNALNFEMALMMYEEENSGVTFDYLLSALDLFPNLTATLTMSPHTLLAPTDNAFKTLFGDQVTIDDIENASPYLRESLRQLLSYHVIAEGIQGATIQNSTAITYNTTVNGQEISVSTELVYSISRKDLNQTEVDASTLYGEDVFIVFNFNNNTITVEGSTNSAEAVEFKGAAICGDGNLYILDTVLVPEGLSDEFNGDSVVPDCRTLDVALRGATLDTGVAYTQFLKTLQQYGDDIASSSSSKPYTIFAPTDQAVANTDIQSPASNAFDDGKSSAMTLEDIFNYQIATPAVPVFPTGSVSLTTLEGGQLQVTFAPNNVTVTGASNSAQATLLSDGPLCGGSYLYSTDQVLIPPSGSQEVAGR